MSVTDAQVVRRGATVRITLVLTHRSHRRLDERLALRFPGVYAFLAKRLMRLPARSRLRQAMLRYAVQRGVDAINRRDFDVVLLRYDPDIEVIVNPKLVALGFEPVYRGHAGYLRYYGRWFAEWGEFQTIPEELIDLGDDRLLGLGRTEGQGLSSRIALSNGWAVLWTLSAGRAVREQYFLDRAEALSAVGLTD